MLKHGNHSAAARDAVKIAQWTCSPWGYGETRGRKMQRQLMGLPSGFAD